MLADTPEVFDVLVMPNLYGDILSDIAAQISGSVGLVGSANIGEKDAMFEAIHGSAPKYKGTNQINPLASICAIGMMLEHLGEQKAAALVDKAVSATLASGKIPDLSAGRTGFTTAEIGDMIVTGIRRH